MKRVIPFIVCLLAITPVALFAQQARPTNQEILNAALQDEIDSDQGTCKEYIRTVMARVGVALGAGYRDCYLAVGAEISGNDAMSGDIIQVSRVAGHRDMDRFMVGYHSAIIQRNNGNGTFDVIDSNWSPDLDERLRHRTNWNPYAWATSHGLTVYFYRLGRVDGVAVGQFPPWGIAGLDANRIRPRFEQARDRFITAYRRDHPAVSVEPYSNNPNRTDDGKYVHWWRVNADAVLVQDVLFRNAGLIREQGLLIYNPETDMAYIVKEGFWGLYMERNGVATLGAPIGDEELLSNKAIEQHFQRGYCFSDAKNNVLEAYDANRNIIPKHSINFAIAGTGEDDTYTLGGTTPTPDPVIPITDAKLGIQPAEPGYRYQLWRGQMFDFLNYDSIVIC